MATNINSSDSFSLVRVGALFSFYGSTLRRQTLVYICVSFILSWLLLIPGDEELRVTLFGGLFSVLGWMLYLSPLSMTSRGRLSLVDTLLPVKASEKLVFFLIYFWVIIPFTLYLFPSLFEWWMINHPATFSPSVETLLKLQISPSFLMFMMNVCGAMWVTVTCLYMVIYARRNRALYGIIGAMGVQIVLGFVGGIYGGIMAFKKGFADAAAGKESPFDCKGTSEAEFIQDFTKNVLESPYMSIIIVIEVAAIVAMTVALYRLLRKPNRS
ncbi:MAG: hypothetical protein K2M10_03970 [Muribaculaceae bacterium]|nr:hypothetical protein [Muribaculaceae bacterium]